MDKTVWADIYEQNKYLCLSTRTSVGCEGFHVYRTETKYLHVQ